MERPFFSAADVTQHQDLPSNPVTTNRHLNASDIRYFIPAYKEKLTQANRDTWLAFVRRCDDAKFWNSVTWADEKSFLSMAAICWRPSDTKYNPQHIHEIRSGHRSVFPWLQVDWKTKGWSRVDGNLHSEKHTQIVKLLFRPFGQLPIAARNPILLVYARSTVHVSCLIRDCFWEQADTWGYRVAGQGMCHYCHRKFMS